MLHHIFDQQWLPGDKLSPKGKADQASQEILCPPRTVSHLLFIHKSKIHQSLITFGRSNMYILPKRIANFVKRFSCSFYFVFVHCVCQIQPVCGGLHEQNYVIFRGCLNDNFKNNLLQLICNQFAKDCRNRILDLIISKVLKILFYIYRYNK